LGRNAKALAILKYLLAYQARPVSQDHLMGWVWPESNLKNARWSLNSAIYILPRILSSCSASTTVNYILLEEGYYRLCPTVEVATDLDEFDVHYEQGRLEKANWTEEAAACCERAVGLRRGDYLIEDLYEDWTMVERERLSNAYVDDVRPTGCSPPGGGQARGEREGVLQGSGEGPLPRGQPPLVDAMLRTYGTDGEGVEAIPLVREDSRSGVRHRPFPRVPLPLQEPAGG
jgi:hypothetical protein